MSEPTKRRLRIAAALGIVLVSLPAQDREPPVSEKVGTLVSRLETGGAAEAWKVGDELARLGDRAVPHIEKALDAASQDHVKLGAARALIALRDRRKAAKALVTLVKESQDDRARIMAIDLMTDRDLDEAGGDLAKLLEQPLPGQVKARLARAVHALTEDRQRQAKDALLALVQSAEPDARFAGAVALAEIKDYESAKPHLEHFRSDPGERGQIAA
ncbi:MAG TPA: HEAT repeat domain-containing protein, partial [Planctomycetota bacterium]|nr:HEAT repeat domain-containing protein [Planctomycetota bacterium]